MMKTGRQSISIDPRKTAFQARVASELWVNIGGRDYRLVGKMIRIGRSLDNDITLEHRSCSRYHAMLNIQGDQIVLEDLKSRNGVKVNGKKIKQARLKDNDEIQIGDLKGVFYRREKASSNLKSIISTHDIQDFMKPWIEKAKILMADQSSEGKKKKMMIAGGAVFVLMMAMMMGGEDAPLVAPKAASNTVIVQDDKDIVTAELDYLKFESCLELEDLGSFPQALHCLNSMPYTEEVSLATKRIKERQIKLTEKRYEEGLQAYNNYYYEIALLKWQEVVLIANDNSPLKTEAIKGIAEAKTKQRLLVR